MYSSTLSLDELDDDDDDEVSHATRPWSNLTLILVDNTLSLKQKQEGQLVEL